MNKIKFVKIGRPKQYKIKFNYRGQKKYTYQFSNSCLYHYMNSAINHKDGTTTFIHQVTNKSTAMRLAKKIANHKKVKWVIVQEVEQ